MLLFKKITWTNFLSTGSAGNHFDLNLTRTTLITGKNGSGKSTGVTDAICFVLFNKPFRNINRGQLVNSVNGKNCIVEILFSAGGREYKIIRGIKPNIFEIYEDGILFNKESSTRDYQKILENQILKYNFRTFTQVVLLGSASFIPFMELPKAARREVIEDVLDISVFSSMNEIIKKEFSLTKESISEVDTSVIVIKERINSQKKIIDVMMESKDSSINEFNEKIKTLNSRNLVIDEEIIPLKNQVDEFSSEIETYDDLVEKRSKGNRMLIKTNSELESIKKGMKFFENNDVCPSCSQNIEHDHKQNISDEFEKNQKGYLEKIGILENAVSLLTTSISKMDLVKESIRKLKNSIDQLDHEKKYNSREISNLENSISQKQESVSVEPEKTKLKQLASEAIAITEQKNELMETKKLQEEAIILLKDNGIKTSIIKEYLPVINRFVNQYLTSMDFFCDFDIDEEFNEVIRSRHRDEFSYESFSQGERQRIDIALMLTFRQIAKMKNSLNCNLLILDEIFSSSLDAIAINFLIEMLNSMVDTNVFVVTHSSIDEFEESFDKHYQFKKVNNFSIMTDLTR